MSFPPTSGETPSMSGFCSRNCMLLPIETSAPTYRNIAAAPSRAQREVRAEKTESSVAAAGGAVAASRR